LRQQLMEERMTDWDPAAFEENLIADMRAHDGAVTRGPLAGQPVLVMTSKGAKSGEPRRAILNFTRDGANYVVAGSKGGAPTDPAWLHNVEAHPNVAIEAEGRTFEARASVTEGVDRDKLWDRHVRALPQFGDYPAKSGRVIPMVRLEPIEKN
jgi:deazaflavin-dependent oxidoreductase (nitroreductase family)